MSTRAWHHKSRKGCKACKVRRVKCDQKRPVCGHCTRLYSIEHCDYEELVSPLARGEDVASARSNENNNTTQIPILDRVIIHDRRRDARLLYHWYSSTSRSLPSHYRADNVDFWSNTVSMWASQHEFVLDAVLATAAMHMWSEDHQKHRDLQEVSLVLMNAAIATHRHLATRIDKSNAEPFLAASILTGFQSQVVLGFGLGTGHYQLPIDQFEYQRGMMAIYNLVKPHMAEDSYLRRVNQLESAEWPTGLPLDMLDQLDGSVRRDAEMLMAQIDESVLHSDEAKGILRSTLSYLMAIEFGLKSGEPHEWTRRRAATMPSRIPVGYISLLRQQDLLAMCILARYYVLVKIIDSRDPQWWARGGPDRQLTGIASLISNQSQWLVAAALERIAAT